MSQECLVFIFDLNSNVIHLEVVWLWVLFFHGIRIALDHEREVFFVVLNRIENYAFPFYWKYVQGCFDCFYYYMCFLLLFPTELKETNWQGIFCSFKLTNKNMKSLKLYTIWWCIAIKISVTLKKLNFYCFLYFLWWADVKITAF